MLLTLAKVHLTAGKKKRLVDRMEDLCALERAEVIGKLLEGTVEPTEHVESAGSAESSVNDEGEERFAA
jgi:hypothetical protein